MHHNPRNAKAFIVLMATVGIASILFGLMQTSSWHPYRTFALFVIAAAASRMKIRLPGLSGNMSVNLPFLLLAVTELNLIEGIVVCGASAVVQSLPRGWTNPKFAQTLFNLATMSLSTTLAWEGFHRGVAASALLLPFAAAMFFFGQTAPVATIIALTGGEPLLKTWKSIAQLTFPYFVLSAGVASILRAASPTIEWQLSLLALPIMFSVFCSYQLYLRTESVTNESLRMAARAGR